MTDQTIPPSSDGKSASELELEQQGFSQYLLYSRSEILFVLKQAMQKKCMLTVYFDAGRSFFLTTLIALSEDGNWLYIDTPSDSDIGRRAIDAKKMMLTTMLEKVKIQFSINGLHEVASGNRMAFAAHLPETLLRLQRREHFRLSTPVAIPLRCHLEVVQPDGTSKELEAPLLDISGGGIGLMIQESMAPHFPAGTNFQNCRIDIPDEGTITTGLCVRNGFNVTTKSGSRHWRVGCEYVDLSGSHLSAVQRYITRVERERKARDAGLG